MKAQSAVHQIEQNKKRTRIRPWHIAGLLLACGVFALLAYAFWPQASASSDARTPKVNEVAEASSLVDVVVLESVDFPLRTEATGHLQPWRRAEISAEGQGMIRERLVEEGDFVETGAGLLALDERDAQIELDEARAELMKMQADFAVRLRTDGGNQQGDTLRVGDTVLSRRDVQAANVGLPQAEQRVARAELTLSRMRITAPFSGRVADIIVETGQRIGIGEKVLTLLDDSRMKVDVEVLESSLVHLRKGATAIVRIPALNDLQVEGTIYAINPMVSPETGAGKVTVAIPNTQHRLITGLFAYIELETERLTDRLVLPTDAVLLRQGRDLVFRVEEGRAQWVYVEVGNRSGDHVEIREGLTPGDTIAVAGHFALAHDARIHIEAIRPAFTE
jgi:HlyD family secretion protein